MNFFNALFGQNKGKPQKAPVVKQLYSRSAAEVRQDNSLVSLYGAGGREIIMESNQWRTEVLPFNIKKKNDDPEGLSQLILTAMRDGFYEDILKASERLHDIDTSPVRGVALYAIALMETEKLKEAEKVIKKALSDHGDTGSLLTLLARVYSKGNQKKKSDEALLQALYCDPNQANAVEWLGVKTLEESGEKSFLKAMKRISGIEGAWRPYIWLGSFELISGNKESAISYYKKAIRKANPLPADGATKISGDLGKAGCSAEVVELFTPSFDSALWGILTGSNVVGACVLEGKKDEALRIISILEKQQQPQWDEHLSYLRELVKSMGN